MWQCTHQLCGHLYDAELEQCPRCGFVRRCWQPTLEEIAAAKARIQEAWSDSERYRREHGHEHVPLDIDLVKWVDHRARRPRT